MPADAVIVTLKARYSRPSDAVVRALDALVWLRTQGVSQTYFCFSDTFNSVYSGNVRGNIGPVVEALMDALNADFTAVVPACPDKDTRLLKGYMFVGDVLLSETELSIHPRTPMTDPNLLRVLQAQVSRKAVLIDHDAVRSDTVALQERMVELRLEGYSLGLVDAATEEDLTRIARAVRSLSLVAGSAGLGSALPQNFGIEPSKGVSRLPPASGMQAVLCGSCTPESNRQVKAFHQAGYPAMALDPLKVSKFGAEKVAQAALAWAEPLLGKGPVLLYSTASEHTQEAIKNLLGINNAGLLIEQCMSLICRGMVGMGVRQLIIGGSDTAMRCLRSLRVRQMQVGPQIDPAVPWYYAPLPSDDDEDGLHVAIKPGHQEGDDFFVRAFDWMRQSQLEAQ